MLACSFPFSVRNDFAESQFPSRDNRHEKVFRFVFHSVLGFRASVYPATKAYRYAPPFLLSPDICSPLRQEPEVSMNVAVAIETISKQLHGLRNRQMFCSNPDVYCISLCKQQ
ncbi:hypothetical protein AVEN_10489-1 [Araneus ventricosus]|uniref:Uncharacterized protein n=1 Tax=Araneus ventricosus TaxID=182803 RepID=A0A4Y2H3I7_ARAVE|nr:hypothetical protein AVEN_10489-1 [Araneus ventricosus]